MTNSTSTTTPLATAAAFVGGALTGGAVWLATFAVAPQIGPWTLELAAVYAIVSTIATLAIAVWPRFDRAWRAAALGGFIANVATFVVVYEAIANMKIEL